MLENLTDICKIDKNHVGYYKISFGLNTDKECEGKPFYSGRFDIADRNL